MDTFELPESIENLTPHTVKSVWESCGFPDALSQPNLIYLLARVFPIDTVIGQSEISTIDRIEQLLSPAFLPEELAWNQDYLNLFGRTMLIAAEYGFPSINYFTVMIHATEVKNDERLSPSNLLNTASYLSKLCLRFWEAKSYLYNNLILDPSNIFGFINAQGLLGKQPEKIAAEIISNLGRNDSSFGFRAEGEYQFFLPDLGMMRSLAALTDEDGVLVHNANELANEIFGINMAELNNLWNS